MIGQLPSMPTHLMQGAGCRYVIQSAMDEREEARGGHVNRLWECSLVPGFRQASRNHAGGPEVRD